MQAAESSLLLFSPSSSRSLQTPTDTQFRRRDPGLAFRTPPHKSGRSSTLPQGYKITNLAVEPRTSRTKELVKLHLEESEWKESASSVESPPTIQCAQAGKKKLKNGSSADLLSPSPPTRYESSWYSSDLPRSATFKKTASC